jgi:HK97 gp10 family phage protein
MFKDNTNAIINQINEAVRNALEEIAKIGLAEIQLTAPVDTGNLRRSYSYKVKFNNKSFVIKWGTNIPYAIYVEMKPQSRGGRPHLRKAIMGEIEEFNKILRKHLAKVGK